MKNSPGKISLNPPVLSSIIFSVTGIASILHESSTVDKNITCAVRGIFGKVAENIPREGYCDLFQPHFRWTDALLARWNVGINWTYAISILPVPTPTVPLAARGSGLGLIPFKLV
jgi:hypothetical protein